MSLRIHGATDADGARLCSWRNLFAGPVPTQQSWSLPGAGGGTGGQVDGIGTARNTCGGDPGALVRGHRLTAKLNRAPASSCGSRKLAHELGSCARAVPRSVLGADHTNS